MPDRSFPLHLAVLGNLRLGPTEDAEKRAVSELIEAGFKADMARQGWQSRQQALTRLRFSIRKPKSFPWKGASNIGVPLIDSQIRRYKPFLMRLVVEADPVVEFVGEEPEAVDAERKAEAEYTWLFKTNMNAIEPVAYILDSMCHRGYGIAQIGWDYRVEYECRVVSVADMFPQGVPQDPNQIAAALIQEYDLDGNDPRVQRSVAEAIQKILPPISAPFVKLAFKRVAADRPALWDRDPVQVLVPPRTTDYGNAEWIIVQHIFSLRTLQQKEADGFFLPGSVAKIVADMKKGGQRYGGVPSDPMFGSGMQMDNALQDEKERIWGTEDDGNVLVWEVFHWYDHDGDGLADRVTSYLHPRTRTLLGCRPYPYPFRRWPFVKFDFEKTSRRFHSPRGISGMLEHLQREVNAQHNARLDAMALHNAPVYQVPVLAGFKARNFRVVPGTVLQMPGGARLEPVGHDRASFPEQVNEENSLRQLAESYVGSFDSVLSSTEGGTRTATEVQAAVQLAASTSSMDSILFQLSMREVHMMVWELWMDLRPEYVSYKVLGIDQNNPEPKLTKVKKSEIDKKFSLYPTGTIANTNHALELANSREALQFFANDQTGFIDPQELRSWYFGLLDYRRARRIVLSKEQAVELQTLRQAAAALQSDPALAAGLGASGRLPLQQVEQAPPAAA